MPDPAPAACLVDGTGLEPCPRCGAAQVWATSHAQCTRCRWVTPCCEGAPLPPSSVRQDA